MARLPDSRSGVEVTILDAGKSRPIEGGPSFNLSNRMTRLAWMIAWALLARWTPRQFNGWRCALARLFGAKVARGAVIYGSVTIWLPSHLTIERQAAIGPGVQVYNMAPITIGEGAIISQRAHLCAGTHDHRDPGFQLYARPVVIGARAWVAAEAFVGPGVTVGEGAVLGARAWSVDRPCEAPPFTTASPRPRAPMRPCRDGSRGVHADVAMPPRPL